MEYRCPDCRTASSLHEIDCRFEHFPRHEIETAYVGIIGNLSAAPHTKFGLKEAIPLDWSPLFDAVFDQLEREGRIEPIEAPDGAPDQYRLLTPDEFAEKKEVPPYDDLNTIYERGSVPGCHDDAVVAMIAYYEMVDFSWDRTKETVANWLRESGAWDRGGFSESSPEEVVENKRHVYDRGYGWKEAASAAASVIEGRVT